MSALNDLFGKHVEYTEKAKKVTPTVIKLLWERYGKDKAICSKQIIEEVKKSHSEIKLADSEVRQIISFIRHDGIMPNLIASGKGYYRSNDIDELETYIKSITERTEAIYHVAEVITDYVTKLKGAA